MQSQGRRAVRPPLIGRSSLSVAPTAAALNPWRRSGRGRRQQICGRCLSPGRAHRDGCPGRDGQTLEVSTDARPSGAALFERLLSYTNDVGLLAEELDSVSGEQLGNFPQALGHMGVINSAIQFQRAALARGAPLASPITRPGAAR